MSIYRGHVENGVIKLDEHANLTEGMAVKVIPVAPHRITWREMTDEEWKHRADAVGLNWPDARPVEEIIEETHRARLSKSEAPRLD